MKMKLFAIIGFIAVLIVGFVIVGNNDNTASEGNDVEDIKEIVHDYSTGNVDDQVASITSHELIVTESDDSESTYNLPEDEFFVSIAPYVDQTHP